MSFYDRLRQGRVNAGYTQEQLAQKIGIAKSTLSGYESGNRDPSMHTISKIMDILNVDANFLWQDETRDLYKDEASPEEFNNIIKKYRDLDDFGKETIDTALARESKRVAQLQAKQKRIDALEAEQQKVSEMIQSIRIYTYFGRIACAGSGFYFDDIPTETIEAPDMGGDFIIGVNGDSMEPDYHDGDKLYVKKTEHISHGDVGIFTIGNECFLKEFGEDGLISRNRDYGDIPGTEDVRLIGKVIGKVEED